MDVRKRRGRGRRRKDNEGKNKKENETRAKESRWKRANGWYRRYSIDCTCFERGVRKESKAEGDVGGRENVYGWKKAVKRGWRGVEK